MGKRYSFLYKQLSVNDAIVMNLLYVPEVLNEFNNLIDSQSEINDNVVYDIIKKVYFPKLIVNERSGSALKLCRAIKKFSLVLFGDKNYWQTEFEEFKNNYEVVNEQTE